MKHIMRVGGFLAIFLAPCWSMALDESKVNLKIELKKEGFGISNQDGRETTYDFKCVRERIFYSNSGLTYFSKQFVFDPLSDKLTSEQDLNSPPYGKVLISCQTSGVSFIAGVGVKISWKW